MTDREQLIKAVEEFAAEEYPDGTLTIYADYRDELSDNQAKQIVTSDHPWEVFYDIIDEGYLSARDEYAIELETEFADWCKKKGYDYTVDDLREEDIYIDEYVSIEPDYDHYLSQEFYCRLIVDNGDANYDFTCNPNQDNNFQIEDGAGILWLGSQIGYSKEQMQEALNQLNRDAEIIDDVTLSDKFLDSLIHEAANAYGCPALTFLCKLSLADLIKFKENKSAVTVDVNGMGCGFFDGYNGGGSVLELELPVKSVTIPADKIYDLVPDVRCNGMYSVDEVYGLWKGAYADAEVDG